MTALPHVDPAVVDVEFRDVTKTFGSLTAVDRLSFRVRQGEFLALLGPSGCGKTTCLRMIAGFEHPDAGSILVGGQDTKNLPPGRRPVNTVFQNYALFGHMSVRRNVEFGLKQHGVPRQERRARAMETLEMVRLADRADQMPRQLSGGQQQRVALARALVLRPRVLLLDEPLAALDLQLRKEMQEELRRLHRNLGITFVFVTHDQGEAMGMADRIAVMSRGRIEQIDSPEVIYQQPSSVFVAGFIGEMNLVNGTVERSGSTTTVDSVLGQVPLPVHVTAGAVGGVRVGIRPESLHLGRPADALAERAFTDVSFVDAALAGEMCRVSVRLNDGTEFAVRRPRTEWQQVSRLVAGESLTMSWSPADMVVLPAGSR